MRVDTLERTTQVTVLRPLDDERSMRLAAILDDLCDRRVGTSLDLRQAGMLAMPDWLVVERCRRRFKRAGVDLDVTTNPDGYPDERRNAVRWLDSFSDGFPG